MSIRPGGPSKADLSGTYARSGPDLDAPDLPTFTRSATSEVYTAAAQNPAGGAAAPTTAPSIYWPWRVHARTYLGGAALDEWYLYYSTDHEAVHANSGIWLATGPTPSGPWTGRGRVFIDNVNGNQTETPSVLWSEDESLFFMYYQQAAVTGANGAQSNMLATSPDGVTWTRVGIALDVPAGNVFPGDGHTGYFTPFRHGKKWFAFHLVASGNFGHFGMSQSTDGRVWRTDPNPLGWAVDQCAGRRVEWNHCHVITWRGKPLLVGLISDMVSGSTPRDGRLVVAPLSLDLRRIVGVPKTILYPTSGTETTNYRALDVVVDQGLINLLYQAGSVFYAATALAS